MGQNIISFMNIKNVSIDGQFQDFPVHSSTLIHVKEGGILTEDPHVFFKEAKKYLNKHFHADTTQSSIGDVFFHKQQVKGTLVIIRGPKGSGKSEITKLLKQIDFKTYSINDLKDTKIFDPDYQCFQLTKSSVMDGSNVAVIGDLKKDKDLSKYLDLAKKNHLSYYVIQLLHDHKKTDLPKILLSENIIHVDVKKEGQEFINSLKQKIELSKEQKKVHNQHKIKI